MPPKKAEAKAAPVAEAPAAPADPGPETDVRKGALRDAFDIFDPEATGVVIVECVSRRRRVEN
jgi:hypothetical protein